MGHVGIGNKDQGSMPHRQSNSIKLETKELGLISSRKGKERERTGRTLRKYRMLDLNLNMLELQQT